VIRVALYWAPTVDDPLRALGARWLGRDAEDGATLPQPAVDGLDLRAATLDPRRYGLHGTLKAPFRLSAPYAALRDAAAAIAAATPAFALPPLRPAILGGFLALVEAQPCPPLAALADALVRGLDRFRAPLNEAELARRRPERLDPVRRANLERWGYPHVGDAFRFHVSLTGRLEPEALRRAAEAAEAFLGTAAARPRRATEVCLFTQAAPDAPFLVAERLPLGA